MVSLLEVFKKTPTFMIVKDGCPYCTRAENLLQNRNIRYGIYKNVNNQELVDEVRRKTGHKTYPMIYLDKKFIGGYDDLSSHIKDGHLGCTL